MSRLTTLRAVAVLTALVATGCGASPAQRSPDPSGLPLLPGARVVAQDRQCDIGAKAFCVLELVVVNPRFRTSSALLTAQTEQLRRRGWTTAGSDIGEEQAADSPGHKLWVSLATPYGDLKGVDLGWIIRSRTIARALSTVMFERASAVSVKLGVGSS